MKRNISPLRPRKIPTWGNCSPKLGLSRTTPDLLLQYCERAIKGREYAKFIFTRNISHILEMLAKWGKKYDFSREDLAYLQINDVLSWNAVSLLRTGQDYFKEQIQRGKELFAVGRDLQLSYIIRSPRDVMIVPQHRSAPNFVGSGSVTAPVVQLDAHASCAVPIEGAIVCIENADPGSTGSSPETSPGWSPNSGAPTRIWPSAVPNTGCRRPSGSAKRCSPSLANIITAFSTLAGASYSKDSMGIPQKIIAVSMRMGIDPKTGETRNALAHDWTPFMARVAPQALWLPVPNIGEGIRRWLDELPIGGIVLSGGDDWGVFPCVTIRSWRCAAMPGTMKFPCSACAAACR